MEDMGDSKGNVVMMVTDGASIPNPREWRLVNAWSISIVGAIGTIFALCAIWPEPYLRILRYLPDGVLVTFEITILSICFAVPLGLLTGLGRISRNRFICLLASTYVEVIRGIPLLVQLFYIYYALSRFFQVSGITSAVTSISICYGAYMGEVFRAGIMAIPKGQSEAARSLGFNRFQTMFFVVLPQAWRTILPPVGNECIAMLKDTSLVSILAVPDIMQRARSFVGTTYLYFETYTVVALIYLVITLILSKCVSHMEGRLNFYDGK
jgi:polar amino acid transport system permease protein